jgi:hypothetical protein
MICGLGHFELSLNGGKVGDHVFDPGWTDYKDTCLYVSFDIAQALRPGENTFGVMLGNGLYNVIGGRYTKFTGSFGPPKMILQAHIVYADGTETEVTSDASWKTHDSPITFSCPYGGEDYDAQKEQSGWNAPGFDAAAWEAAAVTSGPGGVLRAQDAPPIKIMETYGIASIKKTARAVTKQIWAITFPPGRCSRCAARPATGSHCAWASAPASPGKTIPTPIPCAAVTRKRTRLISLISAFNTFLWRARTWRPMPQGTTRAA